MIRQMCGIAALAMAMSFGAVGGYVGVKAVAAAQAPRAAVLKGVIKSIDDSAVVVVPNENKKSELTFKITSATTRTGAVAAGDEITVSYHFEQSARVATSLAGKSK
jgi:hypothetical protein